MAVRTTDANVRGILEVDASLTDLTPFILTANEIVTEVCTDSSYSATRLELIERWLAAHFTAIRDMRSASEKAGSVGVNYQHKVDLNLNVTIYGQQAMLIDTAGNLAALQRRVEEGIDISNMGVSWLGEDLDTEEDD